ncbi:MAG TPA: Hsp70 family protein, partial [Flavipsychrobacter sp.]|nr:Hsp70 family protein [Flavipsychrobacter sp.]
MSKIGINLVTGGLQQQEIIVGIDLGTTNSLIAIVRDDTRQPIALKEIDGLTLVPSVVHFDEYNNPAVGTTAKSQLIAAPERTIYSVKRLMGKSYKDVSDHANVYSYHIIDDDTESLVKIEVNGKYYTPIELSAEVLKELKKRAEHILKTPVTKAVITVPAYFNDAQRQATRDAGRLAGLDVLRILNEPTAASLAYGMGIKEEEEKTIAVYDLGGGTFDVSILKITNGIFEVLATHGDTYLGGDDMDRAIVSYWSQEINNASNLTDKSIKATLRVKAEEAKKQLTTQDSFSFEIEGNLLSITKEK